MVFEQFQASRQWSENIVEADDGAKGYVYLDGLYVEHVEPHWPVEARKEGKWYLRLGNCEWITSDLASLELRLYEWARSEGYFD